MEKPIGQPEMRISQEEIAIIKNTFQGNNELLKLMRKIFLPEYDPTAPLGQTVDLWTIQDISKMTPEECKVYFTARRELILHVESMLLQLKAISEQKLETMEDVLKKSKKDSAK